MLLRKVFHKYIILPVRIFFRNKERRSNVRLWLLLACVPILLSVLAWTYQYNEYVKFQKTAGPDSEEWLMVSREMERIERQEVLPVDERVFQISSPDSTRTLSDLITPEYTQAEIDLARAKSQSQMSGSSYSSMYENALPELAASDEMLEMDGEGNPVIYEVQEEEWLAIIALKLYGHKMFWGYIYDVNRDILSHPDQVKAGMELFLPNREYFTIDSTSAAAIHKATLNSSKIVSGQP